MSKFVELEKMKNCPLCLQKWHIIEESGRHGKCYFACDPCKIVLWVRDIFIGHYDEFGKVPCPTCSTDMRFFCREDAYCKWYCPKCKTTIENYDPDIHTKAVELKKLQAKLR
jgi:hypothetical protein